jgi:hypothetical protein
MNRKAEEEVKINYGVTGFGAPVERNCPFFVTKLMETNI